MPANTIRLLIRLGISGGVFVLFLLHTSGWMPSRLLSTLENITYDTRILLTMPQTVDSRVVIIDLDDKTLAAEGWPFPRDKMGRLVTELFDRYRIRVLGFDVVFAEPDPTSGGRILSELVAGPLADVPGLAERADELSGQLDHDLQFARALEGRAAVLGYVFVPRLPVGQLKESGAVGPPLFDETIAKAYGVGFIAPEGFVGNLEVLQSATRYGGFFDIPTLDEDGVARSVPLMELYEGQVYPSLALEVSRVALGYPNVTLEFEPPDARGSLNLERVRIGPQTVPVDERVAVMVPYRGRERSFPYVSATDVLHGTADAALLENAIAMLGTTAAGLKDLRTTPVGQAYPGVEVHANIVSGILDGRVRQRAPYYAGMEATILFLIGVLLALLFPRLSPFGAFGLTVGVLVAVTGLAFWLWESAHLVMPLGVPVVFTLTVFLTQQLYGFFMETRRSREISKRFGEYVPPEIVEQMAANPGAVSMDGQIREMTVLFSDVRSFTSISEQYEARELAELMNNFLTPLTNVIHKHRGTIDKYMGDAIMAFWGAPLEDPDHAIHALEASLELHQALRALDEPFAKRGWPKLQIGVGLSTGTMRVGNMGSEFRRAYTVMGDPVNLASRVEGLTKEYGVGSICSEFTRNAAPPEWAFRELDSVRVKGKDKPVTIYEPLGPKEKLDPAFREQVARHRGALKLYREQKWDAAEQEWFSLYQVTGHPLYELYVNRIAHYRDHPPGAGWDGVFTFTTK
jgi:adenylate cyclase